MSRVADRYRRLCNRRGNDAWSILFGYPLARLALVWLESWKALRPTHITLASIAARAAGAWLVAFAGDGLILAVALLQLGQVLDSMDGTLARARGQHSALGAFLDRAGDALALGLLCAAVGWRAAGAPWMAAALGGGFLHLLRGYMHWAARGLGAPADGSIDGGRPPGDAPRPLREWLRGFPRLALFNEADLYLWISIGALAGLWTELCLLLLVSQAAAALLLAAHHAARLSAGAGAGERPGSGPSRP
ncbi:MAG TPA: CDP-alcohol phosphatidyltransferase family protein [Kofleriaceae bacterium]|nr:CDP-alcohol phosphatidyltransferase family protein [Kofleriaceae bacterium]